MKTHLKGFKLTSVFILIALASMVFGCTQEKYKESTDETLNITEFLRANEEEYSLFLEILEELRIQFQMDETWLQSTCLGL